MRMARDFGCLYPLRRHQEEMVNAIFDDFNAGNKRVLCVAGTGAGKTTAYGALTNYFRKVKPNSVVLIVSHLGLLINQTRKSLKKFYDIDAGVLKADVMPSVDDRVVVSTVQSSSIIHKVLYWKDNMPDDVDVGLIIIDEVHINSGTSRIDRLLDVYFPNALVVGATGTPYKSNKSMAHIFDKTSYSVSLNQLISNGTLVPPRMNGMAIKDKKDDVEVFSTVIGSIKANHASDQVVVFMKSIQLANDMVDALRASGFSSEAITSKVNGEARDEILEAFSGRLEGSPQVLVTVDVLTAAFDAPQLMAIYMPYGTGSVTTYLQRIGRVLRTHPQSGKTVGHVYIGGEDPAIEQGKWERVQKKAMNSGQRHENLELDYEMNSDYMDDDVKSLTLSQIKIAKAIKRKGMNELAEQVMNRKFPSEFLEHLVPVNRFSSRARMTEGQANILRRHGINSKGFNKNEASSAIDSIAKANGWVDKSPKVPSGKYKDRSIHEVPYSYISLISKRGGQYYNKKLADFFKQ